MSVYKKLNVLLDHALSKAFSCIVGALGLGVGVYSVLMPAPVGEVSYLHRGTSVVHDIENVDDAFELKYNGGEVVKNVYVTNFDFWNSGDAPVRHKDILDKIQLHAFVDKGSETSFQLVNVKIAKETGSYLGASVNFVSKKPSIDASSVNLDWKILERISKHSMLAKQWSCFHRS